jgi:multicomponent K+:H+ antiporter subunit E
MIKKLLPHPLLTLLLTAVWMMLLNSISLGGLILGLILGVTIPLLTAAYWPKRPRLRNPLMIAEYICIVLYDIVVANLIVAKAILFKRNDEMHSGFVAIPLDLRTPEAITVLAGTITMTPGTVSSDVSADGHSLLVHHLDEKDQDALRETIKNRYERRLMEIFE